MFNIRLTPSTTTPKAEGTSTASISTPLPINSEGFGTCECGGDLDTLTGDNGEIRAVFCPYCEFS